MLAASGQVPRVAATFYSGGAPYVPHVKGPGVDTIQFKSFTSDVGEYTALTAATPTIDMMDQEVPTASVTDSFARNASGTLTVFANPTYAWWGMSMANLRFPTNFTAFRTAMLHLLNRTSVANQLIYGSTINSWEAPCVYGNYSLSACSGGPNPSLPGSLTITIGASASRPTTSSFMPREPSGPPRPPGWGHRGAGAGPHTA